MKGLHCTCSHKSKAVGERLFLSWPGDFFYLQRTSFAFWISKYTYTKDEMYNQCPDFNGGSAKPALQPNQAWNLWINNCNCKNVILKTNFLLRSPVMRITGSLGDEESNIFRRLHSAMGWKFPKVSTSRLDFWQLNAVTKIHTSGCVMSWISMTYGKNMNVETESFH